ncbi:MAG: ATP-binding cassette domain-containing protein [Planctomycetota bacterium]
MNKQIKLSLSHEVHAATAVPPGATESGSDAVGGRVVEVASMFGLGVDRTQRLAVIPLVELTLRAGQLVFVTGASGSGKSTLLRLIREALAERAGAVSGEIPGAGVRCLDFSALPEPADVAVVEAVDGGVLPLDRVLRLLSLAGLNDAFVMLRRPSELSDGQRYRFRLAQMMAQVEAAAADGEGDTMVVVLADEFGATLDRTTAAALSCNLRRWLNSEPRVCFITATTHDDLLEPLAPDVLIEKRLGAGIEIVEAKRG